MTTVGTPVPVSPRISGFAYAIRNIVDEARKVEAAGRPVRYLNIGDPVQFGFTTPPHLVEAVERAMRDGHNGYVPSAGIAAAREAVAADYTRRGMPVSPDRVVITDGTSEGIELALSALVDFGEEVLVPTPSYPLYTAVISKIGGRAVFYRTDPDRDWLPDLADLRAKITPATRVLVVIDPNNPTGAVYPESTRRGLIDLADRSGLTILADEVYGHLTFSGSAPLLGSLSSETPIISFSSLSKAYLAPGWRTGWLAVSQTSRLDDVLSGIRKMADGRLCSAGPMQYAIAPALDGDRTHLIQFTEALCERAELTVRRLSAIRGMQCVPPRAAFYAMPRIALPPGTTDQAFVLALLRATGILCVHGSGFGLAPEDGFFRLVYLAPPADLAEIYDEMSSFAETFPGG